MNTVETCLLVAGIPVILVIAGYRLAVRLTGESPAVRLAVAMLGGLSGLIWTVSVVNLALPISGIWGFVCLAPLALTLGSKPARDGFARDFVAVVWTRNGVIIAGATALFLFLLLWPLLSRPEVIFYDATANHDAFFWIVGAEHLKRQNYLQPPVADAVYPLYYSVASITGWRPVWGRMAAEGLLALTSNIVGASPLKIYLAATAALFLPWVAAVFLVARTFVLDRLTLAAAVAMVLVQPLFVFFHTNANLPNLLGGLAGAGVVVALARVLADSGERHAWLILLALSVHALVCSYPEMLPAIAAPCVLLCLRSGWVAGWRNQRRRIGTALGAVTVGFVMNPASAIRGWNGLICSLEAVHHAEHWPDIFAPVTVLARWPSLMTLSVSLGTHIGALGGVLGCLVVGIAAVLVIRGARDPIGAAALLAGVALMLIYTVASGFDYGWQKTIQFSAIFLTALLPVGAVGILGRTDPHSRQAVRFALVAGVITLLGYGSVRQYFDANKWADRKYLTDDWMELRGFARTALRNAPVLVDSATFSQRFFYSMWATYFFTDSRIYFTLSDPESAGYLRTPVMDDLPDFIPAPRAVLVGGRDVFHPGAKPLWSHNGITLLAGSSPYDVGRK